MQARWAQRQANEKGTRLKASSSKQRHMAIAGFVLVCFCSVRFGLSWLAWHAQRCNTRSLTEVQSQAQLPTATTCEARASLSRLLLLLWLYAVCCCCCKLQHYLACGKETWNSRLQYWQRQLDTPTVMQQRDTILPPPTPGPAFRTTNSRQQFHFILFAKRKAMASKKWKQKLFVFESRLLSATVWQNKNTKFRKVVKTTLSNGRLSELVVRAAYGNTERACPTAPSARLAWYYLFNTHNFSAKSVFFSFAKKLETTLCNITFYNARLVAVVVVQVAEVVGKLHDWGQCRCTWMNGSNELASYRNK